MYGLMLMLVTWSAPEVNCVSAPPPCVEIKVPCAARPHECCPKLPAAGCCDKLGCCSLPSTAGCVNVNTKCASPNKCVPQPHCSCPVGRRKCCCQQGVPGCGDKCAAGCVGKCPASDSCCDKPACCKKDCKCKCHQKSKACCQCEKNCGCQKPCKSSHSGIRFTWLKRDRKSRTACPCEGDQGCCTKCPCGPAAQTAGCCPLCGCRTQAPGTASNTSETAAGKPTAANSAPARAADAKPVVIKSAPPVPAAPLRLPVQPRSRPERALDHDWGVAPPIPEVSRNPKPTIELMKASRLPKLEEVLNQN